MTREIADAHWLDAHLEISAAELVAASGLSEAELRELVDYGALVPVNPGEAQWIFSAHWVVTVRTACRLRDQFELDTSSVALALGLLDRIRLLELELNELRAQVPGRWG